MAGGDVITKGASKRAVKPKGGTRAGGDVITKGASRKTSGKMSSAKSNRVSAKKKR